MDAWIKDVGVVGIFAILVIRMLLERLMPANKPSPTPSGPTVEQERLQDRLQAIERTLGAIREEHRVMHTALIRLDAELRRKGE